MMVQGYLVNRGEKIQPYFSEQDLMHMPSLGMGVFYGILTGEALVGVEEGLSLVVDGIFGTNMTEFVLGNIGWLQIGHPLAGCVIGGIAGEFARTYLKHREIRDSKRLYLENKDGVKVVRSIDDLPSGFEQLGMLEYLDQ